MTNKTCESVRDLLVEFADAELIGSAAAAVEAHLQTCASCRAELLLLRESLGQAKEIWEELAAAEVATAFGNPARRPVRHRATVAGLAACASVALLVGAWTLWGMPRSEPQEDRGNSLAVTERKDTTSRPLEFSDVEALIAREAQAARLAMAAELLATEPSLARYRDQADEYLATAYADLPAGQRAKQRAVPLKSRPENGT